MENKVLWGKYEEKIKRKKFLVKKFTITCREISDFEFSDLKNYFRIVEIKTLASKNNFLLQKWFITPDSSFRF